VPITVTDAAGRVVRTLAGPGRQGFNRVPWPLGGGAGAAAPLPIGDYTVTLEVGGEKLSKPAKIRARIGATP